jgi:hypothetical protein
MLAEKDRIRIDVRNTVPLTGAAQDDDSNITNGGRSEGTWPWPSPAGRTA